MQLRLARLHCLTFLLAMRRFSLIVSTIAVVLAGSFVGHCRAADNEKSPAKAPSVADVASSAKASLVTVRAENRDRQQRGLGTGFVIPGGLIVTNLHVTGEGRAFRVEDSHGDDIPITHIEAWDRANDLAVLRADWSKRKRLPALNLAGKEPLAVGDSVVVMGNPLGLKLSVVSGVLSGTREVEGRQMLQLAIPVEPGNSGGPVLDMKGRVHGIVTLKSLVTDNLGFAIRVASLAKLLERPNPIPIAKWRRVGVVDTQQWEPLQATWQQRAATIRVAGAGSGFGGRAQCLAKTKPPEAPYDVAVTVRMTDEAGAAGLVFHADGKHRHYGFYPSNGRMRLTCFLGPTVYSWKVLYNQPSPHYRAGEWNRLRVRVEENKVTCFVNGQQVVTWNDLELTTGRVGLAKFRNTVAEFRHFEVGKNLARKSVDDGARKSLDQAITQLKPLPELLPDDLKPLRDSPKLAAAILQQKAESLERQAAELRQLQDAVRVQNVCQQLKQWKQKTAANAKENKAADLALAALLLAKLDDADLDVEAYAKWIAKMGDRLAASVPARADDNEKLKQLDTFMFVDHAFQGSHHEYYHRANSQLHRVLEDREGLPITLSVLYITFGQRIGLNLEGVGLPGHFVVRCRHATGKAPEKNKGDGNAAVKQTLIDVFHGGKRLDRKDAESLVAERSGVLLRDEHLTAVDAEAMVDRMLRNLLGVAQREDDKPAMLRYLEALVTLDPESVADRGVRAVVRHELGYKSAALRDLDWILQREPVGLDLDRVRQMRAQFERSP